MDSIFSGCSSLTSLDLSNFKTSSVKNMKEMFYNCHSLTSLDLFNFDTHSVTNMVSMFNNCIDLKYLKIFKFDTSSVEKMDLMFYNCKSILSLNLTNFDTKKVDSMSRMFENCNSLIILDLSSFDTSLVKDMTSLFSGCTSLEFLNILHFSEESLLNHTNMFDSTRENIHFCINDNINENTNSISFSKDLNLRKCKKNICSNNWKDYQIKYIPEIHICIDDCKSHSIYKYEFKGFCYSSCPPGSRSTIDDEFLCEVICTEEKPYEIVLIYDCVKNCTAFNFFNKICKINYRAPKIKDEMTFIIDDDVLNGELDELITLSVEKGKKDLLVKSGEIYYQITSPENQNSLEGNFSTIGIEEIEYKLKKIYNLNENDNLVVFKTDIYKEGYYIPIIEYNIYNLETKEKLDLNTSLVEDTKIKISLPMKINEEKIYKFDPYSGYYDDICFPATTENGTDIILNDRINEFNDYNLSLCEKDCEYKGYDNNLKTAKCECKIKNIFRIFSQISVDKDLLFNNFTKISYISNIKIIKCYHLLFTLDGLIKNIGSYIIIIIFVIFIVIFILYFTVGYKKLLKKINQISSVKIHEKDKDKEKSHTKREVGNSSNNIFFSNLILDKKNESLEEKIKIEQKKQINLQVKWIMRAVDLELNTLSYDEALKRDKRTFFQYYFSLLKTKHLLLFSFYPSNDYNLMIIKIYFFFFSFALYYTINALFFNDSTMHKIYEDKGRYNFIYQIPQILYSTIISKVSTAIIKLFALTEKNILDIKQQNKKEKLPQVFAKALICTIIKFLFFSFFNIIFLSAFWYYLACFGAVYRNTQIQLLSDTLISFGISMIYPFGFLLIPGFMRIPALRNKNMECIYKLSKLIQLL